MIIDNTQTAVELTFKYGKQCSGSQRVAAVAQSLAKLLPEKTEYYCFSPYKAMIPELGVEKFFMDIHPADEACCYNEQGEWDEELWESSVVGRVIFDSEKQFKDIMLPAINGLVGDGVWGKFEVRYLDGRKRSGMREVVFS